MSAYTLKLDDVVMDELHCGKCGIHFMVPHWWRQEKLDNGEGFHCPNGHSRVYAKSTVDRLREELAAANLTNTKLAERVNETRVRAERAEEAKARLEKRVRSGLCPCCKRSFVNLKRHMATKHPEKP
jgi:hypothetical protein